MKSFTVRASRTKSGRYEFRAVVDGKLIQSGSVATAGELSRIVETIHDDLEATILHEAQKELAAP